MAKTFQLGLCENRHEIKDINTYLFKDGDIQFPINPSDIR